MVRNISARRLAEMIDDDEAFTLVDTRPPDPYEAWHVTEALNVPYDPSEGLSDEAFAAVAERIDDRPVVAICGKALTSTAFAFDLGERGYDDVAVVTGGMEAWSDLYEVATIGTADDDLVVRQLQRRAKGCLGYVVGSREAGRAVVVDPTRHTDRFKVVAQDEGLVVERVLDTHVHADHISGARRLAGELDVPYHLGAAARERDVEYEYDPLADGASVALGNVEIEALHTPGHTSEMTSYRIADELLFTGDTLFADAVGRTELQFGDDDAAHGAHLLYDSLHETVLSLPEDTTVLPGHLTVSSDGRYETGSPGEPVAARLGDLRERLDLLGFDEAAFVERLSSDPPEKPPNYETVIDVNSGRRSVDDEEATTLELGPNNCAA
ncbi:MBL fold metallo-hydrolase [Halomarina rubra]|uniref:MBL fold metallo-hydrolase n=1 Tax=Halomarina rubra TaxID=2071873 RepID=A0ABD6AXC4_9EURY|nr:MBL fold metallo-hydrolase [Halomarina rubra]